jgi:hypothetical protein
MRSVDMPEALPDGSRFLHIGMPKTGTTALQGAIKEARAELAAYGVRDVSKRRHEMKTVLAAVGTLPSYLPEQERAAWEANWQRMAAEFRSSDARCTFWSSESLSQATGDRVQYLADNLGADTHIVMTLRPLAPLLVSQWQEVLRRRGTETLEEWAEKHFASVRPDGEVVAPWVRVMPHIHRFSLRRVIDEFGKVFGEDRIILVMGDSKDRLRNFRVFEALMGVPEILKSPELDNASLPYPEAEMLRHFNSAYTERGGDHATWMFTVGELARRGLRELTNVATPYPIRGPRWIAERANEYTLDWIEAVKASDVTVVGDLQSLLTDADEWDEKVEVPTEVSVETAGRLMDVGFAAALEYGEQRRAQVRGLDQYGGRELLREVGRRAKRRVSRRA